MSPRVPAAEEAEHSEDLPEASADQPSQLGRPHRERPTLRRTVKAGVAVYEASRIAAAIAKRGVRKLRLRPLRNAKVQSPPTCPRCQRTFRTPIELAGYLRANRSTRTVPTVVSPSTYLSPSTPSTNSDRPPEPALPSCSSSTALTSAAVTSATHINVTHNPDKPTTTNTTIADMRGEDLDYTCSQCDRTSTSHIDLVGHFRIHRAETGEPVPGVPTYTRRIRSHCSHCPRTCMHHMGLFGHMRTYESGISTHLAHPAHLPCPAPLSLRHPARPPPPAP
nr:unnamed protein product [Spirometra erinaceieuropaei]